MITCALLLVGLALAGDGRPPAIHRVYPVADLLLPDWPLQVDEDRYLRSLLQSLEADHVPFPETDLILPLASAIPDPLLGYYPPSKALIEKRPSVPFPEPDLILPPSSAPHDPVLGFYPPSKRLVEKRPSKRE
jgi:hypothetical protein